MTDLAHRRLRRTPAAAAYLGYSPSTLEKKRVTGDGPPFFRLSKGGTVVYDEADLDAWLDTRRATSTSEADTARGRRPEADTGRHRGTEAP